MGLLFLNRMNKNLVEKIIQSNYLFLFFIENKIKTET